jgi:oligosaccharide repeat unit polymerase
MWPNRPAGTAEWYAGEFYPDIWAKGGAFAFSPVAEAYLNFGVLGVPVVFFLLGALLAILEKALSAAGKPRDTILIAYALVAPLLCVFFRFDSATLAKEVVVALMMPIAVAHLIVRLLTPAVRRPRVKSNLVHSSPYGAK